MRHKFIALAAASSFRLAAAMELKPIIWVYTPDGVQESFRPKCRQCCIKSGDTVTINTVSGRGGKDAAAFFAKAAFQPRISCRTKTPSTILTSYGFAHPGGKTMTGPIYIDGAEPGEYVGKFRTLR